MAGHLERANQHLGPSNEVQAVERTLMVAMMLAAGDGASITLRRRFDGPGQLANYTFE